MNLKTRVQTHAGMHAEVQTGVSAVNSQKMSGIATCFTVVSVPQDAARRSVPRLPDFCEARQPLVVRSPSPSTLLTSLTHISSTISHHSIESTTSFHTHNHHQLSLHTIQFSSTHTHFHHSLSHYTTISLRQVVV